MKKTLMYSPESRGYDEMIMVAMIKKITKSSDGRISIIHLLDTEKIYCMDSIKTLQARIEED